MQVIVIQNQVERALKVLKRQLIKEGLFKELKARRFYLKPSVKKKIKIKEAQKAPLLDRVILMTNRKTRREFKKCNRALEK